MVSPCPHQLSCPRHGTIRCVPCGCVAALYAVSNVIDWLPECLRSHLRCPLENASPCHFPLRVELPPAHRFTGLESSTGVRAEKISYLVVSKGTDGTDRQFNAWCLYSIGIAPAVGQSPPLSTWVSLLHLPTSTFVFGTCRVSYANDGPHSAAASGLVQRPRIISPPMQRWAIAP